MPRMKKDEVATTVTKAKRAVKKAAAPAKPEVYLQFADKEVDTKAVVDAARAAFKAEVGRVAVKSCKVYLKPDESAAYYVINDDFTGKIDL